MKRSLLITALVVLPLFVTSSVVALEDSPVFGKVATTKKTAIKAAPNAHAAAATTVDANTDLRWVMGRSQRKVCARHGSEGPERMGFGSGRQ